MPVFRFDLSGVVIAPDEDGGIELPDEAAAGIEAVRLAGELLRDRAGDLAGAGHLSVTVTDAQGRACFFVRAEAVSLPVTGVSRH